MRSSNKQIFIYFEMENGSMGQQTKEKDDGIIVNINRIYDIDNNSVLINGKIIVIQAEDGQSENIPVVIPAT